MRLNPADLREIVIQNIRRLAQERGLPVSQVADFAGIARPAFFRALAGGSALTTDRLCKIAAALDVHPAVLLDDGTVFRAVESSPRKPRARTKRRNR